MNLSDTAERTIIYGLIDEVKDQIEGIHTFLGVFEYLRKHGEKGLELNEYEKYIVDKYY